MSDVFISYASPDRERARKLADALARLGWSVWWDRVIPVGRTWDEVIEEQLDNAASVVVLWSKASSSSSWVRAEATEALRRGVLAPVMIEPSKIPLEFRRLQAADLSSSDLDPEEFERLCTTIRGHVRRQSGVDGSAAAADAGFPDQALEPSRELSQSDASAPGSSSTVIEDAPEPSEPRSPALVEAPAVASRGWRESWLRLGLLGAALAAAALLVWGLIAVTARVTPQQATVAIDGATRPEARVAEPTLSPPLPSSAPSASMPAPNPQVVPDTSGSTGEVPEPAPQDVAKASSTGGYRGPEGFIDLPVDPKELLARIKEELTDYRDVGKLRAAIVTEASEKKVVAVLRTGERLVADPSEVREGVAAKADQRIRIRPGAVVRVSKRSNGEWFVTQQPLRKNNPPPKSSEMERQELLDLFRR